VNSYGFSRKEITVIARDNAGPAWRPRLVALDVDGTLPAWTEVETPADEPAGSRILAALYGVLAAGAHIVLCSGRAPGGITRVVDRLGLLERVDDRMWLIASNGAALCRYAPLEVVHSETFDARPAVHALLARNPRALVAVEHESGYRLTAPFPDGELPGDMIVTRLEELLAEPVGRVVVRDPAATPEEFVALVAEVDLPGVDAAVGWSAWLDLTPAGVSKASGLRHVCAALGLTATDVLAIGDGRNDIEMLRWAGRGVAVEQAPEDVLAAADATTAPAEEDGVAQELARWFPC
jgi:HAD superfamily hydrolase (TIGR01484 family)